MSEESLKRFLGDKGMQSITAEATRVGEVDVKSLPPEGATYKKVVNIYVELIEGQPKLRVEYEV